MIKKKKAQSEIITTVLIILLVLAAIVIVWQVVSRTIATTSGQIDPAVACMGVQTDIVSAKSADTLGTCSDATKTTKVACVAPETWSPAANAQIIVQRNTASSKYNTKARLYVNGIDKSLPDSSVLKPAETYEFTVSDVTVPELDVPGAKVKAVTFLSDDKGNTAACTFAEEATVI